jgi:MurNAc alpha-1-phosphate uridylyltransferase
MRPLTDRVPKPLLEVGGKPLITWHIERLAEAGFERIVINHAFLGALLEQAVGDGARWGIEIRYSPEATALETGGGIRHALPLIDADPFLVVNGDIWCDLSFDNLALRAHDLAHLWLVQNPPHHAGGDFVLRAGRVLDCPGQRYTFSGIGLYRSRLFEARPPGRFPLAPLLRAASADGRVGGALHTGRWSDVGTPRRLAELNSSL